MSLSFVCGGLLHCVVLYFTVFCIGRCFRFIKYAGLQRSHVHRTDAVLAGSHVRCRGTEAADIEAAQVVAGRRVAVSPAAFVCYQDRAILAVTVAD